MKKNLFWVSVIFVVIFWPLSFLISNKLAWYSYFLATSILILDYFLYSLNYQYHYFLYLVFPLIHPAYLLCPFFALPLIINTNKNTQKNILIYGIILFCIAIFSWKPFLNSSIFIPDLLAKDTLIKNISLIPNRQFARIFENKASIPLKKLKTNIFESFDLNNHFFAFHPQELSMGQNLTKFSFLTIVPFLIGLFFVNEQKQKKWLLFVLFFTIISIGFINNQNKFDLLLFVPISIICIHGLKKIYSSKNQYLAWLFLIVYISGSVLEFLRLLAQKQ